MRHDLRWLALVLALIGLGSPAQAQSKPDEPEARLENETPLPTQLRTTGLIPIMIPGSDLRFGVDPESVSVGGDEVIRYVVVATSRSGALNAMQEGVRCIPGEVKTYARYTSGGGWVAVQGAVWRPLSATTAVTRHSAIIARNGLCGYSPAAALNRDANKVVRDLRAMTPAD